MSVLALLGRQLEALPAVRLAAAFGSVGRGDERKGSDVDLGLLLEPDSAAVRQEVEAALARATERDIDVVYLNEAPPLLRFEVSRDGRLLVERGAHEWSDFRAHAMIDWWDWAPTARRIADAAIARLRERVSDG